jgi:hypothetical protein
MRSSVSTAKGSPRQTQKVEYTSIDEIRGILDQIEATPHAINYRRKHYKLVKRVTRALEEDQEWGQTHDSLNPVKPGNK